MGGAGAAAADGAEAGAGVAGAGMGAAVEASAATAAGAAAHTGAAAPAPPAPADEADEEFEVYRMTFPRLPQEFTGTGDLAAALLLAWTHRLPGNLAGALERVAGSMRAILTRTHNQGSAELLLVQSKGDIEQPPLELRATVIVPAGN
ncbi:unnamed protein product [Scytosiphon promiscuus]